MARVLVIEDDRNIRKLVAVNLAARGYEVIEAEDARQGLQRLRDGSPSVMLLDIKLPDMSGWELLRIAAVDSAYPQIPIIVITASLNSTRPDDGLPVDLRRVFVKPLNIQELTAEVQAALN
jgi:two-component system, OmpR family, KDP operon response regulator KdpE